MTRIEFSLQSPMKYAGYYSLWAISCYLLLFVFFSLFTEAKNIYIYFITVGILEVFRFFQQKRIGYQIVNGYLHIRSPHLVIKTTPLKDIVSIKVYSSTQYRVAEIYTVKLTLKNGKKLYLYPETPERLIALLQEEFPEIQIIR